MSRRFATLADLMTGRGGVHEVSARRLVPVAVADLEGVDRLSSEAVLEAGPSGAGGDARDAAASPSRYFESHVEYVLPVASAGAPPRSLHVLRLLPEIEANLRAELLPRAHANARRGYDAMERLVRGPDAGVTVSNVGGYQSAHDVLEPDTWSDSDEEDGEKQVGEEQDGEEQDGEEDGDERLPRDAAVVDVEPAASRAGIKGWGMLSEVARVAHDRVRDRAIGERVVTRDDLYGWLNCNAPGDFNKLHDHGGAESWSGVYYLQCPAPMKGLSSDSDSDSEWDEAEDERAHGAGALGLRCHASDNVYDCVSDEDGGGDTSDAAVPYLRFQPRAGDLIVFRGDVLHAVESNGWARSGVWRGDPTDADMGSMRMSVAFNEDSAAADRKAALALAV